MFDAPLDEAISTPQQLIAHECGDEVDGSERLGTGLEEPGFQAARRVAEAQLEWTGRRELSVAYMQLWRRAPGLGTRSLQGALPLGTPTARTGGARTVGAVGHRCAAAHGVGLVVVRTSHWRASFARACVRDRA